jgi:hypothetical protein
LSRTLFKTDDAEKITEGKKIMEELVALKYELQHDRKLTYETRESIPLFSPTTARTIQ